MKFTLNDYKGLYESENIHQNIYNITVKMGSLPPN